MSELERYQDPLTIQRVLHSASTIAVVGLSGNELRASNFVGYYLRRHGYRVIPVNPRETEILGEPSFPSLSEVPEPIDIVNVFRTPDALPPIAVYRVGAHHYVRDGHHRASVARVAGAHAIDADVVELG